MSLADIDLTNPDAFVEDVPHEWFTRLRREAPVYWHPHEESAGGGLSSGDKGYFDADGRLFIVGREDDMIVSGGENVYPLEVENLLNGDGRIVEAAVVGVDDERFGQVLKAVIVVADGEILTEDDVKKLVTGRLARFKVPKIIEFTDALPRTATGKLLRRKMI